VPEYDGRTGALLAQALNAQELRNRRRIQLIAIEGSESRLPDHAFAQGAEQLEPFPLSVIRAPASESPPSAGEIDLVDHRPSRWR
jgi:hypothetical protein